MLRDHQSELLLGRRSAKTLRLTQDEIGVAFELTVPNTSLGQDTFENVRLGNLKGCSFGFQVRDDDWQQDASGKLTRIIKNVLCFETTLTAFPAYPATSVDLRSIRAKLKCKRESDDDELDVCNPDSPDYDPDTCDEEDRSEECSCDCPECLAGDCSECSDPDCDDPDCYDEERCPNQLRQAHYQLLLRRLR
jgi:HK97 family phage prohead protease